MLRDQNKVAKASAERRQRITARSRTQSVEDGSSPCAFSALVVHTPLAEDREFYAQTFFVSAFVTPIHDTRTDRGYLEVLPLMFDRLKPGSLLSLALSVISHSLYAAWEPQIRNGENTETQIAYSNAIAALRDALRSSSQCVSDETLMAVLLLGNYEVGSYLIDNLRCW